LYDENYKGWPNLKMRILKNSMKFTVSAFDIALRYSPPKKSTRTTNESREDYKL